MRFQYASFIPALRDRGATAIASPVVFQLLFGLIQDVGNAW